MIHVLSLLELPVARQVCSGRLWFHFSIILGTSFVYFLLSKASISFLQLFHISTIGGTSTRLLLCIASFPINSIYTDIIYFGCLFSIWEINTHLNEKWEYLQPHQLLIRPGQGCLVLSCRWALSGIVQIASSVRERWRERKGEGRKKRRKWTGRRKGKRREGGGKGGKKRTKRRRKRKKKVAKLAFQFCWQILNTS